MNSILKIFLWMLLGAGSFLMVILGCGFFFVAQPELNMDHALDLQKKESFVLNYDTDPMAYKLLLIEKSNPRVLAVGSSRAMQFRKVMFKKDFITAGYAVHSLSDLEKFMNILYSKKNYQEITDFYFTIDPEWLNTNYQKYPKILESQSSTNSFNSYWNVTQGLIRYLKKYPTPMFLSRIHPRFNPISPFRIMGLGYDSSGFREDGSYFYYGVLFNLKEAADIEFHDTLNRIQEKRSRFEGGETINPLGLDLLTKIKNKLLSDKKNVIFILPPYALNIYKVLEKEKESYKFLFALKSNPIFDFDLTDPRSFGGENICEFIDGVHGSDVTYLRILKKIYATTPNTEMKNNIDIEKIDNLLKISEGRPLIKDQEYSLKLKSTISENCKVQ